MNQCRTILPKIALVAALLAGACVSAAPAQAAPSEAQIKAAYLYKLASFVRWPPAAFPEPTTPLRVCVAGRSDVHAVVALLVRDQYASGHPLAAGLVDPARPEGLGQCHILFVGQSEGASLLAQTSGRPILTVTDRNSGTRGGVIEFVIARGSVRFLIHRQAAEARQLVLSSKLLAVAVSVER